MLYNWMIVLHIISFVSWMAALFYMPRLLVYHAEHSDNTSFCDVVKVQERKLFYMIGLPAMIATLITGSILVVDNPAIMQSGGWIHAKMLLVVLLIVYFFSLGYYMKKLGQGVFKRSGKFFRFYNELPTIIFILIVILVIIKPF